jgi:hypothetical protein
MRSQRIELSEEEAEWLEEIRSHGFSSHSEILRCATLSWINTQNELASSDDSHSTGSEEQAHDA